MISVTQSVFQSVAPAVTSGVKFLLALVDTLFDSTSAKPEETSTYQRNSPLSIYTNDGLVKTIPPDVLVASGSRVWENELAFPEDLENAAWTNTFMTVISGIADPDGGSTAFTLSAPVPSASLLEQDYPNSTLGSNNLSSWFIKRRTGTGAIFMSTGSGGSLDDVTSLITNEWQRVVADIGTGTAGSDKFGIFIPTQGDEIDVWHPQGQDLSGRSNIDIPDEYAARIGSSNRTNTNTKTVGVGGVVTENTGLLLRPQVVKSIKTNKGTARATMYAKYEPYQTSTAVLVGQNYISGQGDTLIPQSDIGDGVARNCVVAGTTLATEVVINTNRPGDSVVSLITVDFDGWDEFGVGTRVNNGDFWTITDNDLSTNQYRPSRDETILDDSLSYTSIWEVQKPTAGQTSSRFQINVFGGSMKNALVEVIWATETIGSQPFADWAQIIPHETIADRFYITQRVTNNSTGNTTMRISVIPAAIEGETGSLDVYGFSIVKDIQAIPPTLDFGTFTIPDWEGLFTIEDSATEVVWAHEFYTIAGWLGEDAGTNELLESFDLTKAVWAPTAVTALDQVGIEGKPNTATTLTDNNGGAFLVVTQRWPVANDSSTHSATFWVGKEDDETSFPEVQLRMRNGSEPGRFVQINKKTGAIFDRIPSGTGSAVVFETDNFWVVHLEVQNNATGNTEAEVLIFPAVTTSFGAIQTGATGSCVIGLVHGRLNQSFIDSPIITGVTTETRVTSNTFPQYPISNHDDKRGTYAIDIVNGDRDGITGTKPYISLGSATTGPLVQSATGLSISDGLFGITKSYTLDSENKQVVGAWSEADDEIAILLSSVTDNGGAVSNYDDSFDATTPISIRGGLQGQPTYTLNFWYIKGFAAAAARSDFVGFD